MDVVGLKEVLGLDERRALDVDRQRQQEEDHGRLDVKDHVDRIGEADLVLLGDGLGERPAQAGRERGDHDQDEAEQVELGRVVGEQEEARRYAHHNGDDRATLKQQPQPISNAFSKKSK